MSKTDPIEIIYTMVVVIASLVSIIFLVYIMPYTKSDDFSGQYPLVWIGFFLQWACNIGLEISHIIETYDCSTYGNMRLSIMVIGQLVIDILCMIIVSICVHKCRDSLEILKTIYYAMLVTFGWSLLRQLIMLSFYTFVYAAESISTIGIVAFGVIFTVVWSHLSKGVYKKVQDINIVV